MDAMVPSVAEPPATPLTNQLIVDFEFPDTVAVNRKLVPARTFAVAGEMATEVEPGVPGLLELPPELFPEFPEPVAAQPANKTATKGNHLARLLMASEHTSDGMLSAVSVSQTGVRGYWT